MEQTSRFRGSFDYAIDDKGRCSIPARFRKVLSPEAQDTFVVCLAPDRCLRAYPLDAWLAYEDELKKLPETPESLRFSRLLYSTINDSTLDAQGRISLTARQTNLAGIEKKVTLIGRFGHIEIWDTDRYRQYFGDIDGYDQLYFNSLSTPPSQR